MDRLERRNPWVRITLRRLVLILGAGAVAWFGLLVAEPTRSDSWPYRAAPTPFSLKIRVTDYERNPAGNLAWVMTQAQRSDGATVIVETVRGPHVQPHTFRALRLPDGTRVTLVDAVSAKSTCRPKQREVAVAREVSPGAPGSPNCLRPLDKLLGRAVLFGQEVDVVKTWDLGSGGEEWLAPALGCKELQWQNATLQPDGSRRIELEGKLVSFTLGEPDARFFDSGVRYAEIKPSELRRREMQAAGVPWSSALEQVSVREDYEYAAACTAK
jgi:hypothetical protein